MNTPYVEKFNQIADDFFNEKKYNPNLDPVIWGEPLVFALLKVKSEMHLPSKSSVHLEGIDFYITPEQCHSSNNEA